MATSKTTCFECKKSAYSPLKINIDFTFYRLVVDYKINKIFCWSCFRGLIGREYISLQMHKRICSICKDNIEANEDGTYYGHNFVHFDILRNCCAIKSNITHMDCFANSIGKDYFLKLITPYHKIRLKNIIEERTKQHQILRNFESWICDRDTSSRIA